MHGLADQSKVEPGTVEPGTVPFGKVGFEEKKRRAQVNARNKFLIVLGVVFAISLTYYLLSTPRGSDLDLTGTVDANQVIVSPQVQGRILKLLVEEGTKVKQGDLIASLDPSELEAQSRAAAATIDSFRS